MGSLFHIYIRLLTIGPSGSPAVNTLHSRARNIDAKNANKVLIDFTFSLKTATASSCRFELKQGSNVLLNLSNMGSISGAKTDLINALNDTTGIGDSLIIVSTSGTNNLYKIYQLADYSLPGDIIATIVDDNGLVIDTMERNIGTYSDDGYMDIFSTISALARMPVGTNNPFYPTSIPAATDSTKLNLLIAAMLDLSIAHNSPLPESNEQKQGIQTNYMQFMDNIVGNWATLRTATSGIGRLRAIHSRVFEQNKGEIIDPVYVVNYGTSFENAQANEKRKNYLFYTAFSRLNWDLTHPTYTGVRSGVGIMFNISPNVEMYSMNYDASGFAFDTIPFLDGSSEARIIFSASNAYVDSLKKDNRGVWVAGIPTTGTNGFYTGVKAVRLPIAGIHNNAKIDTAFSLPVEGKGFSDAEGVVVEDGERSLFKIEPLTDGERPLENTEDASLFLHGQKRKLVYNEYFREAGTNVDFRLFGDTANVKKVLMLNQTDNSIILHDTSQFNFKTIGAYGIERKQSIPIRIARIFLGSYRLALWDAVEGKAQVLQYLPKKKDGEFVVDPNPVKVTIENDPNYLLPVAKRANKYFTIRWSNPCIKITDLSGNVMFPVTKGNKFGVVESDFSQMHVDIRDWVKLDNEFYKYGTDQKIGIIGAQLGLDSIDFALKSNRFNGEYLKETLRIKAVSVTFSEHESQTNGFDQVDFSDDDYISIDGFFGEIQVYVEINPFENEKYLVKTSNYNLLSIDGQEEKKIVSNKETIKLKIMKELPNNTSLFIAILSSSGTFLKKLNVMVYKRKNVQKIYFDRITDLNSPKTKIPAIVSKTEILEKINNRYRQAIIRLNAIEGKENDTCAINFDKNVNGRLDYYYNGSNPEFDVLKTKFPNGEIKIAQVQELNEVWRVDPSIISIPKGALKIKLEGVSLLEIKSNYYFGKQGGENEEVFVESTDPATNQIILKTGLKNSYDNADKKIELYREIAGLSSNPILVTQGSDHISFTIAHELLHRNLFGNLIDVKEDDNLMYYRRKSDNIGLLRYRKQHNYYKKDDGRSGLDQWTDINRDDIN